VAAPGFRLSLVGSAVALVLAAAEYGLLILSVGARARGKSLSWARAGAGALVSFAAGAALFPAAILLVQVPLQTALSRIMMAAVATADQAVLSIPAVLVTGLVQEPAKLLAAGVGAAVAAAGRRSPRAGRDANSAAARALTVGAAAGVGAGFAEAAFVLSVAFAAVGGPGAGGEAGRQALALAVAERASAVLFHLSTTGIVVFAWTLGVGRGVGALGGVSALHGLVDYSTVFIGRGMSVGFVEAAAAVAAAACFGLLVGLVRRASGADGGGRALERAQQAESRR